MYRVIWVDQHGDYKRDIHSMDRESSIALAKDYDANAAGKYDSVYVYKDNKIIWLDGHEYPEGG